MKRLLLALSIVIVVRETFPITCPSAPVATLTRQEDGTYERSVSIVRPPGICTRVRWTTEQWSDAPERGGVHELVLTEREEIVRTAEPRP